LRTIRPGAHRRRRRRCLLRTLGSGPGHQPPAVHQLGHGRSFGVPVFPVELSHGLQSPPAGLRTAGSHATRSRRRDPRGTPTLRASPARHEYSGGHDQALRVATSKRCTTHRSDPGALPFPLEMSWRYLSLVGPDRAHAPYDRGMLIRKFLHARPCRSCERRSVAVVECTLRGASVLLEPSEAARNRIDSGRLNRTSMSIPGVQGGRRGKGPAEGESDGGARQERPERHCDPGASAWPPLVSRLRDSPSTRGDARPAYRGAVGEFGG
jgi:hypothetical protein